MRPLRWLSTIPLRLGSLFRSSQADRELDDELRDHLALKAADYVANGVPPAEARRRARLDLQGVEQTKEQCRDARRVNWIEDFVHDLRFAARTLRKSPGFTTVAVLTLALGIGATTAIFTLIDAVMLKSLPVANPEQLYRLGDNNNCCVMSGTQNGGSFVLYSYPLYEHLRDHTPEFSELAAFSSYVSNLSIRRAGSAAESFKGEYVSGNYFAMFGLRAFAGRLLFPSDNLAGASCVAVLSYHTWQERFEHGPAIVGSTLDVNGFSCTIVGVAPEAFYGDTLRSDPPDFWLPIAVEVDNRLQNANLEWLYLFGRLKPGSSPERLQPQLTSELLAWLGSHMEVVPQRDWKDVPRQHIRLTHGGRGVEQMQRDYAAGLRLLITLAALLLLIACANIANLLLTRGSAMSCETAVRLALGAPRGRLIRQMLTESLLVATAGGAAGLYVAYAGTRAILLIAFRGANFVPIEARPSLLVLGSAGLLSVLTGIAFGIAPAWMASQSDPMDALRGTARSTPRRFSVLQRYLVIAQVGFSVVLLAGAGLVMQSLRNLEGQNFGFVSERRLIANIDLSLGGYTPDGLTGLFQRFQEKLPQIPGVVSASLSSYSPLSGNNWNQRVYIDGKPPDYHWTAPSCDRVSPHYFETIGTRLLQGRTIDERDTLGAPDVAVINETFARRFFANENPIGRRFGMDKNHPGEYEIVGIVEDAKYQDTRGPAYATFFLPLLQTPRAGRVNGWFNTVELHVAGIPENFESSVRNTVTGLDPNLVVVNVVTFGEQVARNFNQERLIARLTELFGALALVLACIGLYAVTAYRVAQRTGEIGIRMALGAGRASVLGLVSRDVLVQVGLGLAIGMPVALAAGRLLAHQLYGVKSSDPWILGAAALVLASFASLAASIPAWRAVRVDPMVALRHE
ncbi:MAG TPA: ABC transporter permease [Candidatus Acidoferrales bacterium]|nr:ABC transporter permease [Candidatus Acidoferrales bacterium]